MKIELSPVELEIIQDALEHYVEEDLLTDMEEKVYTNYEYPYTFEQAKDLFKRITSIV